MTHSFTDCISRLEGHFAQYGMAGADARAIAEEVLYAELTGRTTHGFEMIPALSKRAAQVGSSVPAESQTWPAVTVLTASGHPGPMVAKRAADRALSSAKEYGVGVAFSISASPFLAAGYQPYRIALEERHICIATTVAKARVAPAGGSDPLMGTNPLAVGIPSSGDQGPIVFDSSMTLVPAADIRRAARLGRTLEPGIAFDSSGRPTEDPESAQEGAMVAFGGHKGSGLAMVIEALVGATLGVKCGWEHGEMRGMLHLVLRSDAARTTDEMCQWVRDLESDVLNSRPLPGARETPRFPGERSHDLWTKARANGFQLSEEAETAYLSLGASQGT